MSAATALLASLDGAATELGQAIALLAASGVEQPERLTVGEGDRLLLALCRTVTGSGLEVVAACPACGELSEAQMTAESSPSGAPGTLSLGEDGGLRTPTYGDLLGLPDDPDNAVRELLGRCVVGRPSRAPVPADLDLVDDSLAGPVMMRCSACGELMAVDLDAERAVLQRLAVRAREVEVEIHLLASAYHWSLTEIDGLGDERRRTLARLVADSR